MRKIKFSTENYYHIYNRGTEKRQIFLDNSDYSRFIHYLYEFNNTKFDRNISRKIERGLTSFIKPKRDLLVEIIAFCLMPNHFHLILKQSQEDGIIKFMQKVGTGYAMYFNGKNQRNGSLFQGVYKSIFIESDEYLTHLSRYIHINPAELIEPNWKKEGVKNWDRINKFLENYRWSSYLDYVGIKNFPSLINTKIIKSYFQNEESYKNFTNDWLINDLERIGRSILE